MRGNPLHIYVDFYKRRPSEKNLSVIHGMHRPVVGRALRQFNRTTPQVSSPQGKILYATRVRVGEGGGCSTCASNLGNVMRGERGGEVRVMPHNN